MLAPAPSHATEPVARHAVTGPEGARPPEAAPREAADSQVRALARKGPGKHIDALTGFRFVPALMVVFSHVGSLPDGGPVAKAFKSSLNSGVTIFFVLSGFVLAHNYFDRFAAGCSLRLLRSYIAARIARIYPLYILMLVWVSFAPLSQGQTQGSLWLEHALALQTWRPTLSAAYAFNTPAWSVSVEVFLYSVFPLLVLGLDRVLRTRRGALIALGGVISAMALLCLFFVLEGQGALPEHDARSAYRWLYRTPLCRLGDFCLGIIAARLVGVYEAPLRRHAAALFAGSAGVFVALMCWPAHVSSPPSWDFSYALPATLMIATLAAAPQSRAARFLSARVWLVLGEASYALYLCHVHLLAKLSPPGLAPGAWYVERIFTVGIIVAAAIGFHVAFERPARTLLRRLLDPAARPSATPAQGEGVQGERAQGGGARPSTAGMAGALALAGMVPALLLVVAVLRPTVSFDETLARALTLIGGGRSYESLPLLDQAEQLAPDAFAVHNVRCVALAQLHRKADARAACQRALEIDPTSQLARNNLAWVESL
jgi:peptidoglycan/LPS O-acetylase OafA/YrhL